VKIVHVYDGHERVFPGEGSVPTIVYQLAKYTARIGHSVTILERRWHGLSHNEEIDGITFKRLDLRIGSTEPWTEIPYKQVKNPISLSRLILDRVDFALKANKWLRERDFDVIHVHIPFAATVLITLNKQLRQKMVYTAHLGEERKRLNLDSDAPLILKLFSPDIYLMKRISKNIVLNEALKSILEAKGLNSLEVVPNGIEIEYFPAEEKERRATREKYGTDRSIVMFAGTITPRKGVEVLLKAANSLKGNGLYLLAGNTSLDSEYTGRMMEFVKVNGLEDSVEFAGHVPYDRLRILHSVCDVFVLPSFEEGLGMVLLEAMASGKPVIGSKVGGIPTLVRDKWNGFLVDPGDEKQLAKKIKYLLNHPQERQTMGDNSRRLAEEFDWKNIAAKYLRVYEDVANQV